MYLTFAATAPVVIGHTLPIVLGSLTVLCGLAVFFSCRFVPLLGESWQTRIVKSKPYQRFYKYHSYYWWFFWMLMLLHVFAAMGHTIYGP